MVISPFITDSLKCYHTSINIMVLNPIIGYHILILSYARAAVRDLHAELRTLILLTSSKNEALSQVL